MDSLNETNTLRPNVFMNFKENKINATNRYKFEQNQTGSKLQLFKRGDHHSAIGKLARNCGQLSIRYANKTSCFSTFPVIGIIFSEIIYGMEECFLPYPNNSPGGQFPTVQDLVLMSGFIPW